jgi:hypothetical protein
MLPPRPSDYFCAYSRVDIQHSGSEESDVMIGASFPGKLIKLSISFREDMDVIRFNSALAHFWFAFIIRVKQLLTKAISKKLGSY